MQPSLSLNEKRQEIIDENQEEKIQKKIEWVARATLELHYHQTLLIKGKPVNMISIASRKITI